MKKALLSIIVILFAGAVITQDNEVVYSFTTANDKTVQLLYNAGENIFTYQFISNDTIELEIQDVLNDDEVFDPFKVTAYFIFLQKEIQDKSISKIIHDQKHLTILPCIDEYLVECIKEFLRTTST
jgi:hydroxymethylpyrimidine pyrophosphatase-like HAD family hydrolase